MSYTAHWMSIINISKKYSFDLVTVGQAASWYSRHHSRHVYVGQTVGELVDVDHTVDAVQLVVHSLPFDSVAERSGK